MTLLLIFVGLGGFSTGLVVGVVFREAIEMFASRKRRKYMEQQGDDPQRSRRLLDNVLLVALFAVVILQAGVGLALLTTRNDLSQVVQCQAAYNQTFSKAYRARVTAANNSRDKLNDVFFVVFEAQNADNPQQYQQRFRDVLAAYVKAEKNYQTQRAEHPLPPLPNTYCDRF